MTRRHGLLVAVVALLVVASVARFQSPHYTLEPPYTDHLRHEYSSWAFLHLGFRVFDTPLEQWHVHARHVHTLWGPLPVVYPPGLLVLFLPFGVASNEGWIADPRVHMLLVMLFGAAAVLASWQFLRTLRLSYEPALAGVLAALGTILYVTWGLDGFVDPLAAGLALLGVYWAARAAPGRALVALTVALSLQFRLWYLWPVAIALALRHRREIARWQLGLGAVLGIASLVAFVLAVPSLSKLDETPGVEPNLLALTHGVDTQRLVALVAGGALVGLVYAYEHRWTPAVSVGLALLLVFGVDQWQAWYPILMTPVLALVRTRAMQVALTFALLELVFYLGGFPNVLRSVQLFVDAVR